MEGGRGEAGEGRKDGEGRVGWREVEERGRRERKRRQVISSTTDIT